MILLDKFNLEIFVQLIKITDAVGNISRTKCTSQSQSNIAPDPDYI